MFYFFFIYMAGLVALCLTGMLTLGAIQEPEYIEHASFFAPWLVVLSALYGLMPLLLLGLLKDNPVVRTPKALAGIIAPPALILLSAIGGFIAGDVISMLKNVTVVMGLILIAFTIIIFVISRRLSDTDKAESRDN